ncbi:MAG: hypothetical protein ABIS86_17060 [Streptosporangiaceae bacterium]
MTAVAGTVYTAANWNTHIRDNLNATGVGVLSSGMGRYLATTGLGSVAERAGAVGVIATGQSTASATFVDLATVGPTATPATGVRALVVFGAAISNSTAGAGGRVSVALSGSNTQAAADTNSFYAESGLAGDGFQGSWVTVFTPITAGTTTFTLKYRAVGGTATFANRAVSIIPF